MSDNPVEEQDPANSAPDSLRPPPAIPVTVSGGLIIVRFGCSLLRSLGLYVRRILLLNILIFMAPCRSGYAARHRGIELGGQQSPMLGVFGEISTAGNSVPFEDTILNH